MTTKTLTIPLPVTENPQHGFYGTMRTHKKRAWAAAIAEFNKATQMGKFLGCNPAAIAVWLDSTRGRHFADRVNGQWEEYRQLNRGRPAATAHTIENAVARCVREYFLRADGSGPSIYARKDFVRTAMTWYAEELAYDSQPSFVEDEK